MPSTLPTAYLLISHGSRDLRHQTAMFRLAQLVRERLQLRHGYRRSNRSIALDSSALASLAGGNQPHLSGPHLSGVDAYPLLVGTAALECGLLPLHQQIAEFSQRVRRTGIRRIKLVPLFLLRGVHVMEDIPAEIAQAEQLLENQIQLELCPHLGSHGQLSTLLGRRAATLSCDRTLLLAHGSRRPGGNRTVEAIAKTLGATAAYWSVPPDLETQVIALIQSGCQRLAIVPYFLFAGGTTDAITQLTEELAERFPKITFRLLPPLGATGELADVVVNLVDDHHATPLVPFYRLSRRA
ncbi:Sirohydrochlorin cobaltochelatase [Halomicronema hongdechloris C2206]|uniref:Sirohydrochlorin cobaltochelatase n=1 Tax=Halomicronema hongdechloris C2206 TaxID=1641165 RepID=A0A1Z3HRC9_9CYAN|nr:sirohydrochlorin chelatase [Halomicronema hongdechloris]ASC72835.1 Sirohydrochlorin cobaltochelatase [Halomicronema hongdechloris C2206]